MAKTIVKSLTFTYHSEKNREQLITSITTIITTDNYNYYCDQNGNHMKKIL